MKLSSVCECIKNIFIHAESQTISFQYLFLRKLLKDVFYQSKELNQERGRHRIPQNRIQYRREAKRIPCAEGVPHPVRSRGWRASGEKYNWCYLIYLNEIKRRLTILFKWGWSSRLRETKVLFKKRKVTIEYSAA